MKEEGRAGRGVQVGGEHGVREGVDVGSEGDKLRRGRQIGGEQGVREGVKEELLREGREERNEGGGR